MYPLRVPRARTTAIVAVVAGLALGTASQARADALTRAGYQLRAGDGRIIGQGDCLTDPSAAATSFCGALIGRNDGSAPARSGAATLQWLRDARAAGAATVILIEAGDGFDGRTTYSVPADDTTAYRETTVGSYPPSTRVQTRSYEVAGINAMAAVIDCISGTDPSRVKTGPYGNYCVDDAVRPVAAPRAASAGRHRHRAHHKVAKSRR